MALGILAGATRAVPPRQPLDRALAQAELVVVGKLGRLTVKPRRGGVGLAYGDIAVRAVLKGPKNLTTVKLRITAGPVMGPVQYREGAEGVWILRTAPRRRS